MTLIIFFVYLCSKIKNLYAMLEMSKYILKKVSFDKRLFRKELLKSLRWLKKEEALLLKSWCLATFGSTYANLIKEVFEQFHK